MCSEYRILFSFYFFMYKNFISFFGLVFVHVLLLLMCLLFLFLCVHNISTVFLELNFSQYI
jgi:hypothetical protein